MHTPSEDVYRGELLRFPGPWAFRLPRAGIILVSDAQLDELQEPDRPVDLSLSPKQDIRTLRQVCEDAAARGARTLVVAFDHFWSQYRPGQGHEPRKLMPDTDGYIERIARISRFAESYGLGLELSLVSPLELGVGYRRATGEAGRWVHYREGIRDVVTGGFTVQLWQHRRWGNNKGAFEIEPAGFRVFAFREGSIGGTALHPVSPDEVREVSACARLEDADAPVYRSGDFLARRVTVHGSGMSEVGPLDRVLVVLIYRSPEMDYFSPKARDFLMDLLERYHRAGVRLNGLYADEMHIQQDWGYFSHHEHGQFALRYASEHLARRYAERYGEKYADFDRFLVYFCYGQHDFLPTTSACAPAQHVFGPSLREIHETFLFRQRYYHLLEGGVVDLMTDAKRQAERLAGHTLEARAHVTWAESPTIDLWDAGPLPHYAQYYEYTSAFRWSNTVHQAASACQDYFRWNDFLTGGGNDHAEGGYADRDYFALALACSTGILNDTPYAYAAHWGLPAEVAERRAALVNAYGASASPTFQAVEGSEHRDVDVLMLYPIDLVAVEERFGSWMVQYGYANMVTAEKFLAEGRVTDDGRIELRGRRFGTVVALFEPFPSADLLAMLGRLAERGGRVIWSGPPPLLTEEGDDALAAWQALFGVRYEPTAPLGIPFPGRTVRFGGALSDVPPQTILTDFLVDHVYPLQPTGDATAVAHAADRVVGTMRTLPSGGSATALGFRPRDDQSASLGEEVRTWFEILAALGAYPPTGRIPGVNDNTEYVSRTTPYLACRFPNGTTALALHFRTYPEGWHGGFHRDAERDRAWLEAHPLPLDRLSLKDFAVNGRRVTYDGRLAVAFRLDERGELIAFAGHDCAQIAVDGRVWRFAEAPLRHVAWATTPYEQRVEGGALMKIWVEGGGIVRVPVASDLPPLSLVAEGATPGSRGEPVQARCEKGVLTFEAGESVRRRWVYGVTS